MLSTRARRRRGFGSAGATNARARLRGRRLRSGPCVRRLPSHPARRRRRASAGAIRDLPDPFPPATPAGDRATVRAPPSSTARACEAPKAAEARPRGRRRQPHAAPPLRRREASPARAARPATASRPASAPARRTGKPHVLSCPAEDRQPVAIERCRARSVARTVPHRPSEVWRSGADTGGIGRASRDTPVTSESPHTPCASSTTTRSQGRSGRLSITCGCLR